MPEQARQAEEAVRHIGTKALPFALKWIQYESPGWQFQLAGVMWKIRMPYSFREPLRSAIFNDRKRKRVGLAFRAFKILGEQAAPAIPDLVRLLHDRKPWKSERAANALAVIGRLGLSPLLDALSDTNFPYRGPLPWAFRYLGKDANPAIPVLIRCMQDGDDVTAELAFTAWRELGIENEEVVPTLTNDFAAKDAEVRRRAVRAFAFLVTFGLSDQANQAVPALRGMLNDPDHRVREEASNTLAQIGSQAATNPPTQ